MGVGVAQYVVCVVVGLMFAVGGVAKLVRRDAFSDAVSGYRLFPAPLLSVTALALSVVEVVIGVALLIPGFAPAAIGGAALLALFATAIAINLFRGRSDVDCGCNPGQKPEPIGWALVMRNLTLAAVLLLPSAPLAPTIAPLILLAGTILWGITRVFATLGGIVRPAPPASYRRA